MLKLAKLFSNGMVLQREKPVHIWGQTEAGNRVKVEIQGKSAEAVADATGCFDICLEGLETSLQENLVVTNGQDRAEITDVAVGEVFIAGGQSNMEFPLRYEKHHEEALQTRDNDLRFFDTPKKYYPAQDTDFDYSAVGHWRKAESAEDLGYFSAVAFYFAKEIRQKEGVPVGIVGCNWGGTRSCAWMDEETVKKVGESWMEEWEKAIAGRDMDAFWASRKDDPQANAGNPGTSPFDAMILPRTPSREEIAANMMETAIQGMKEAAKNDPQVAAMVENAMDEKGNINPAFMQKIMEKYRDTIDARIKPGILYEHMVKNIAPFTARGVLWYQGESDDVPGLQALYTDMFTGLVGNWRALWQDADLPFIEVQLPGWHDWMDQTNLDYATIRRCQEEVAKTVEGVYMASISDVGEEHDIHPKDKKTVGHRMALLARHYLYGEDLLCEAPRPVGIKREADKIIIDMEDSGENLQILGSTIEALQLRSADQVIPYNASVAGNALILSLDEPTDAPIQIRFAKDDWYRVNLVNAAGIPAIPFETRC